MTILEQLANSYPNWLPVKLTRAIETGKSGKLRDETVEGLAPSVPEVGRGFILYAAPRDEGHYRVVYTSPIVELTVNWPPGDGPTWTFHTASGSVYEIEQIRE